jgi:putative heme-binding domain-containing protein
LELLKLIELDNFNRRSDILYKLLDNRQPLALQQEALQQLWASDAKEVADELLNRWASFGPEARKGAGNILLYKTYNHDRLLSALEGGKISLGELNFDLERRRELLFSENDGIRKRAEALFSDAGVVTRKVAMEKMRPALDLKGDVAKGKALFENLCGTCHRYGELGQDVGPVLTEIQRKSKASLLHDILDPNAAVDTKYLNHRIQTNNGDIYVGIVEQETDTEISLRMIGGQSVQIPKKEVASFASLGQSLMPEGLEGGMNEQDMADLLAFLQQEVT